MTTTCNPSSLAAGTNCCATNKTVQNFYTCVASNKEASDKVQLLTFFYQILKHSDFIYDVIRAKKMAREYYNRGKNYCVVLNMNKVSGGSGRLNLLPQSPRFVQETLIIAKELILCVSLKVFQLFGHAPIRIAMMVFNILINPHIAI